MFAELEQGKFAWAASIWPMLKNKPTRQAIQAGNKGAILIFAQAPIFKCTYQWKIWRFFRKMVTSQKLTYNLLPDNVQKQY